MTRNEPEQSCTSEMGHRRWPSWLVPCLVLLVAGCVGSGSAGGPPATAAGPPSDSAIPASTVTAGPSGAYREIEFKARDGVRRSGRLFGEGTVAVVLSHMGRPGDSQDDWVAFAEQLADEGYRALTYERRATLGEVWQDVLGAADYLRDNGADTVIVAGASIGAMASLYAAEQPDSDLNGVIWLAGVLQNRGYYFQHTDVSKIACPLLFISGDRDIYGASDAARRLHDWAATSELFIVHSPRHGTDILAGGGSNAGKLTQTMLRFIEQAANEPNSTC